MSPFRELRWDSEFFGARIGRADIQGSADPAQMADEGDSFDCVYVQVDDMPDPSQLYAYQEHGFRVVDMPITVRRDIEPVTRAAERVRPGNLTDLDGLAGALDVLAPWSRFAVDPRFGRSAARRMYQAWVERSVARPDELFAVAEDADGTLQGFVTVSGGTDPTIGLLAVDPPTPGTGSRLLVAATAWAAERGGTLQTTTQARNRRALRFFGSHGYLVVRTSLVLHRWSSGPGGSR